MVLTKRSTSWRSLEGGCDSGASRRPRVCRSRTRSLYIPAGERPAFFGSLPWPWVHPETGATDTLPAKVRFNQIHGILEPTLSISDVSLVEGNDGTKIMVFTVARTATPSPRSSKGHVEDLAR